MTAVSVAGDSILEEQMFLLEQCLPGRELFLCIDTVESRSNRYHLVSDVTDVAGNVYL
jgi:hypothetical protein